MARQVGVEPTTIRLTGVRHLMSGRSIPVYPMGIRATGRHISRSLVQARVPFSSVHALPFRLGWARVGHGIALLESMRPHFASWPAILRPLRSAICHKEPLIALFALFEHSTFGDSIGDVCSHSTNQVFRPQLKYWASLRLAAFKGTVLINEFDRNTLVLQSILNSALFEIPIVPMYRLTWICCSHIYHSVYFWVLVCNFRIRQAIYISEAQPVFTARGSKRHISLDNAHHLVFDCNTTQFITVITPLARHDNINCTVSQIIHSGYFIANSANFLLERFPTHSHATASVTQFYNSASRKGMKCGERGSTIVIREVATRRQRRLERIKRYVRVQPAKIVTPT